MLGLKMDGRRMIPMSRLHLKVKSPDLQSDWVTIGVVVQKSDPKKSQTGKTYSIWKLSDLQEADSTVSFFLFGQVYKQLWKMDVGCVIGLLNPSIMDAMEKSPDEVALTINNAAQVMDIGQSRDLGWCLGKTKRGTNCTKFISKRFGDYCTYHVQAAYRKQSAQRSELHGSCPGTIPKSSLKQKILQNGTFFYGGETFTSCKGKGGGKRDTVTLGKLQNQITQQDARKVSTLSVQDLLPEDKDRVEKKMSSQHEQPFLEMLSMPTVGSMNLVRHMAKKEESKQVQSGAQDGQAAPTSFKSVHASDLIRQHRQQIAEKINERKEKALLSQEKGSKLGSGTSPALSKEKSAKPGSQLNPERGSKPGSQLSKEKGGKPGSQFSQEKGSKPGSQLSKEKGGKPGSQLNKEKGSKPGSQLSKEKGSKLGARTSPGLSQERGSKPGSQAPRNKERCSPGQSSDRSSKSPQTPSSSKSPEGLGSGPRLGSTGTAASKDSLKGSKISGAPMIGKGFYPGGDIDLFNDDWPTQSRRTPDSAEVAKRKAIQKIQAKGGLEKVDPNATGPKKPNLEKIRKRVHENIENDGSKKEDRAAGRDPEPARKRSRLLGNVDPNSDEVKQLLGQRSTHTGALAQAEADREDRYFDNLEKKEAMEEKMLSVTSMEVTVVTCVQCKYTAMSAADRCKQERHEIRRHKGKRRFFACKKCKHRTVSLHRYPNKPCAKCGEMAFDKTSMHKEKSGPKLESETLCLRGDESKYIGSLDEKVYLSTIEQQ